MVFDDREGNDLTYRSVTSYSYWNVQTNWKIGVYRQFDSLRVGVTLITPALDMFGWGETYLDNSFLYSPPADSSDSFLLASNLQQGLDVEVKNPLSVAVGLSYKTYPWEFNFTGEWFQKIEPYDVLKTSEFIIQSTGEKFHPRFYLSAKNIFNFGIGGSYRQTKNLVYYFSAYTDYTFYEGYEKNNVSFSSWDIYHLVVGANFTIFSYQISSGFGLGFGKGYTKYFFNLLPEGEDAPVVDTSGNVVRYFGGKFIFGISF